MAAGGRDDNTLEVDGHAVALTHLDKVVYPETGTTKAEVLQYYLAVAPAMLPHISDRIVTRRKWPDGVTGEMFYEKNLPTWAPSWLKRVAIEHSDRAVTYPVVHERADLLWLAQSGALELHTPQWRVGPRGKRHPADGVVFDLDPGPPAGLDECTELALWLRERLAQDGAESAPVTSGSKGIQVYAPWPLPAAKAKDPSTYAKAVAAEMGRAFPELVVATMTRSERTGKVLVDWSQNNPAKTTVTPYSLRGLATPTVATPRSWNELEVGKLTQLTMHSVIERLETDGDPLADVARLR